MDDETLEIKVNGKWVEVADYIFRSWTGGRMKNGLDYVGPTYYLGTMKETNNRATNDGSVEPPEQLSKILEDAGLWWDDLRYLVEEALAEQYDLRNGTWSDEAPCSDAATAWAARMAGLYLLPLDPGKDV